MWLLCLREHSKAVLIILQHLPPIIVDLPRQLLLPKYFRPVFTVASMFKDSLPLYVENALFNFIFWKVYWRTYTALYLWSSPHAAKLFTLPIVHYKWHYFPSTSLEAHKIKAISEQSKSSIDYINC